MDVPCWVRKVLLDYISFEQVEQLVHIPLVVSFSCSIDEGGKIVSDKGNGTYQKQGCLVVLSRWCNLPPVRSPLHQRNHKHVHDVAYIHSTIKQPYIA
jgi:hypothetical protein